MAAGTRLLPARRTLPPNCFQVEVRWKSWQCPQPLSVLPGYQAGADRNRLRGLDSVVQPFALAAVALAAVAPHTAVRYALRDGRFEQNSLPKAMDLLNPLYPIFGSLEHHEN